MAERLTEWSEYKELMEFAEPVDIYEILDRLAAYEDTNKSPEEIETMLEELAILKQQIADGKLVEVETVKNCLTGYLNGEYYCTRVWDAWSAGTMTEDDFEPIDVDEIINDIINISKGERRGNNVAAKENDR